VTAPGSVRTTTPSRPSWRPVALLPVLLPVLAVVLAACAAGPNASVGAGPDPAGFWLELWHGLIAPVAFVVSLFTDDVNVYEVRNVGNWYDLGLVLGLSVSFSGAGSSGAVASRRRRRR
jgi:hypothetical protein